MPINSVILLKQVEGLGGEGEEVSVKPGYARNYLFPRNLAIPVTHANRKQIEALNARREEREAKEKAEAEELAGRIDALNIGIAVKTGESGKMFGAVTANDLYDKIVEAGVEIDRKRVSLPAPVKELGRHSTEIKLHPDVTATLNFEIVSENPIEENTEGAENAESGS